MEPERAQPEGDGPEAESRLVRLSLLFYGAMMAAALIWRVGFYGEPIFFFSEEAAAAGAGKVRSHDDPAVAQDVRLVLGRRDRLARGYDQTLDPLRCNNE